MSKIRMNTEYRNKLYNKIKDVFERKKRKSNKHFYKQEKYLMLIKEIALILQDK